MSTSIMKQTVNLRDLLENLFSCFSQVENREFSSETSLFLFVKAGVTLLGNRGQVNLFACTLTSSQIQIFFTKGT